MSRVMRSTKHGKKSVDNVMTPLIWAVGIIEALIVGGLIISNVGWIQVFFAVVAVCLIVFYCTMYAYFALKDPNRLQSEHYNLAQQEMTLKSSIEEAGTSFPSPILPPFPLWLNSAGEKIPNVESEGATYISYIAPIIANEKN